MIRRGGNGNASVGRLFLSLGPDKLREIKATFKKLVSLNAGQERVHLGQENPARWAVKDLLYRAF